jgi:hypothetical protein
MDSKNLQGYLGRLERIAVTLEKMGGGGSGGELMNSSTSFTVTHLSP